MAQAGLFDSCLTDYVQQCLEAGARIVSSATKAVGTLLCPRCLSEKDLRPTWDGEKISGHRCGCGHTFSNEETMILTFGKTKEKK